jgi:type IX secretion system PorP/SprF family membrane protein
MRKISFTVIILLSLPFWKGCGWAYAQQDVQFTQYMFNMNSINPAYTGSRGVLSTLAMYRAQWVGFDGAPVTQTFNANTPLMNDKLGIGFTILNEKIGPIKQTGIFADFAYRLKFFIGIWIKNRSRYVSGRI